MCSLENDAFSVLNYVTLLYLMLHRFEIHSALQFSRMALLGCRLAASRLRKAARWQLFMKLGFSWISHGYWSSLSS